MGPPVLCEVYFWGARVSAKQATDPQKICSTKPHLVWHLFIELFCQRWPCEETVSTIIRQPGMSSDLACCRDQCHHGLCLHCSAAHSSITGQQCNSQQTGRQAGRQAGRQVAQLTAGRQAGSSAAHSSMTGKLLNLHLQLLQQQHDRQAPELAFAAIAVLTKLGRGVLCKQ